MSDSQDGKSYGPRLTRKTSKSEENEPSLLSIDKKLNSIISTLETTSADIRDLRKKQGELVTSVELCHDNIQGIMDSLKKQGLKIDSCEREIEVVKTVNVTLERKVNVVESQLNDIEQYSHRNNLIVYGIPEYSNEKVLGVIKRLAEVIEFPEWSSSLVDAVHRMGSKDGNGRPIIIKFVSRLDRDMFLQCRKRKRNLRASDLGYSSDSNVYVNESLTPANRRLLLKTREAAKKKGYAFAWTYNCVIYVRKSPGEPARKITHEDDLETL